VITGSAPKANQTEDKESSDPKKQNCSDTEQNLE